MSLDLDNPVHVEEALRWSCKLAVTHGADVMASLVDAMRPFDNAGELPHLRHAAQRILADPTQAADLLRRLLERCGFCPGMVRGEPTLDAFAYDHWPTIEIRTPSTTSVIGYATWSVELRDVPRVVLALLDAKDRDAAIAALRGEP